MIESKRMYGRKLYYGSIGIKDSTQYHYTRQEPVYRKFKRPLLSYRGKIWCWIIAGLTVFYSLAYAVIQELTR